MDNIRNYVERLESAYSRSMRKLGPELAASNEYNLTGPQLYILRLLDLKGKMMASEISNAMHVKPSAITVMIERLYKNHLVIRERDNDDRRVVFIEISERGKEALEKANTHRRKILGHYLSQVDETELESFIATMEKIARIVQSENRGGKGE